MHYNFNFKTNFCISFQVSVETLAKHSENHTILQRWTGMHNFIIQMK